MNALSSFAPAVGAEFSKILTTRMWWVLALVLFVYVALISGGLAALFAGVGQDALGPGPGGGPAPMAAALPPLVYSFASSIGYVFPVLFGALATTSEFRHQMLTPTFLANPRRVQVLVAKSVALFVVGACYGLVGLVASVGLGASVLAAFGVDPMLASTDTWALFGRVLLAMALWAVIGVGLGVLVPSQVASIVIVLAFTQFVEPLLRLASSFADWTAQVGQFLPGAASDALVGASFFSIASNSAASLSWWQGGLVLAALAVVATVGGHFVSWRRDVT